jgi:hypothetical protein
MQHLKPPGGRIGIQSPLSARISVQIVKPDRQTVSTCILCVLPDLKIADRAVGILQDGSFWVVFHAGQIGRYREEFTPTCAD